MVCMLLSLQMSVRKININFFAFVMKIINYNEVLLWTIKVCSLQQKNNTDRINSESL